MAVLKPDNASSPHLTIVLSTPANRPPNAANWCARHAGPSATSASSAA